MKENYLELKEQLCFPLYLCSKEIIRKYNDLLKEYDLTYTQYIVMQYFWECKTSNVKNLGRTLILDSSTLTPLLKKLEKKGYVSRNKSLDDERNLVLSLTKKGIDLREKIIDVPSKIKDCLKLKDAEINELHKLLNKVLINIESENK